MGLGILTIFGPTAASLFDEKEPVKINKHRANGPHWRPSILTWGIVLLMLAGTVAGLYPSTAAWFSSYNQSKVISTYEEQLTQIYPSMAHQRETAREYNDALTAGVSLDKNANVPTGTGSSSRSELDYSTILRANSEGMMGRIQIPGIKVDLPIYHGTSTEVLDKGAGHLEGSHLPAGGIGTRSVITAHRGLANATMFTDLDRVKVGDLVNVEVFGEILSYSVTETKVIDPQDTQTLRSDPDRDLISLITCTPLGINTQRIVVTAQRITPTPPEVVQAQGQAPNIPGFPWWIVAGTAAVGLTSWYIIRQGIVDARNRQNRIRGDQHVSKS